MSGLLAADLSGRHRPQGRISPLLFVARVTRRVRLVGAATALAGLAATATTAGCTTTKPAPVHSSAVAPTAAASAPASSSSPAQSASETPTVPAGPQVRTPTESAVASSARTPVQVAIAVSRALYASSPVAVVAAADTADATAAAAQSTRLGVPMLLAPADDTSPSASAASPSPDESSPDADDVALATELDRLGCTTVLTFGAVPELTGVRAVQDAGSLPAVAPASASAPPLAATVVLVHADAGSGTVAATASATAAGASVVAVHGNDPRADDAAVTALAKQRPQHVVAASADFGTAAQVADHVAVAQTGARLPGGGQLIFPGHRFVALYGNPAGPALGILGAQDLPASVQRAKATAAQYDALSTVPVIPTFEIIAVVAAGSPGADGLYVNETSVAALRPWVDAAASAGMYVVLDIQPGRGDPLALAQKYAPLLASPNVGLAIDPEWALGPNQLPLQQIGGVDAAVINQVGQWLDEFTRQRHLPQKLFVVHQFRLSMIGNEPALRSRYDDIALLIHMDGQGSQPNKDATWRSVVAAAPKGVPFGWKDFTKEDHPMLTPQQTMAHQPQPTMISYQ
jgi:hypothetical protein